MSSVKTAYCSYLKTSEGLDTYNQFKSLLYSNSDSLVEVLDGSVIEPLAVVRLKRLRVCDIGGGDGRRISGILRHLYARHGNSFELDFVEQSGVCTETFQRNPVGSFCNTNIHAAMFEDTDLRDGAYDLVLLIHSIFAFDNGNSVEKVLSLRGPTGKIIVASNASHSFLGGLKQLVDDGFSDQRYEIDDLEASLSEKGLSCVKFPFKTKFSLSKDIHGPEIQTVLEWITLGRFSGFSDSKKQDVYQYFEETGRHRNGRLQFCEDEVALIVPGFREGPRVAH